MPTQAELKKISRELRSRASRAVHADFRGAPARIRRLLDYVRRTPILREEVERCPEPAEDPLDTLERARENGGRLTPPTDDREHLGFLHQLLKRMVNYAEENGSREFWRVGDMYAGKRGLGDGLTELLNEVVGDYKDHLERRVVNDIIDYQDEHGEQRQAVFRVEQYGSGQLNVTQAGGAIEANQTSGQDAAELISAAADLVSAAQSATDLDSDTRSKLVGLASQVQFELQGEKPDRSKLETVADKLRTAAGTVTAGTTLYTKAQGLYEAITTFLQSPAG